MCSKSSVSCPLCCQSNFPSIESLKINLIKVNSKPLQCPLCSEVLLGLDKLTIHLFGHTLPGDEFEGKFVGEDRQSSTLKQNTRINNVQQIKVETVENVPKKNNRRKNIPATITSNQQRLKSPPAIITQPQIVIPAIHNEALQNPLRCDICGLNFPTKNVLDMHLNLVHNLYPSSLSKTPAPEESPVVTKFQCHLCSKYLKMKGSLRIHMKVAHIGFQNNDQKVNICDYLKLHKISNDAAKEPGPSQGFSQPQQFHPFEMNEDQKPIIDLDNNIISMANDGSYQFANTSNIQEVKIEPVASPSNSVAKIWSCDVCAKSFTTKYFLKKHNRLHTGEMPYSCPCGKTFTFQQSYHKHLMYHNDLKPYVCQTCGRSFKELSTLHNHERIHTGEKPYKCEVCDKAFRQRVSYLVHRRIHTGVLPYKCSVCQKSFRYKVSQRTHKCDGILVRQPGELLQKLMQNSSNLQQNIPQMVDVTDMNDLNRLNETMHSNKDLENLENLESLQESNKNDELSLDEFVKYQYDKLVTENNNEFLGSPQNMSINDNLMAHSPSQQFQNLTILESNMSYPTSLDTINEDSMKELLYGNLL